MSCKVGLVFSVITFAMWAASLLTLSEPVGRPAWVIAILGSISLGVAYGYLRLQISCARRQEPAGLALFQQLTRDLPVMLYQFRQYPTGRTTVTRASEAIRYIYELTPEEAREDGGSILDLVHPEDRDRIWKSLVRSYRELVPWHEEYRVVLPKAGAVWRSAHARVQRMPDGGTLWHGFTIDINDQKRDAAELHDARTRAEKADAAKTEFLAMMSHDIRTPMNAVLGFAELLSSTDLTDDQREYLASIRSSGESLLLLINEILDLSRVESGKMLMNEEPFELRSWIKDIVRTLSLRAADKGIAFDHRVDPSAPEIICTDRARLSQVIQNLAVNAIKFTDEGRVSLSVSARPGASPNHVRWSFKIEDTGIGIPADKLDSLFEPFRQVRNSDAERQHGVGLGLAIARRITQVLGGDIEVQTKPGSGTCMTVAIESEEAPRSLGRSSTETPLEPTCPAPTEPDLSGLRVLVVEDNPLSLRLALLILDQLGCICQSAGDGNVAVDYCREQIFDLLLMDFQLPTLNGPDAARQIRELERDGHLAPGQTTPLPIVALTANALHEHRNECLAAGMDHVLTKPIRRPELIGVLRSAASGKKPPR
ncbi:MAG: ATP-binding protein [Chthoniobacterales bacterium]